MQREHATALVQRMAEQPLEVDLFRLPACDQAMLRYVVKLTNDPGAITDEDVQTLRQEGFDDCAIHDICNVAAYFAFVNRVADGLGVELEKE